MSSLFIDRIKTLKINDLNRKVTHKNDFKQSKKLMAWNKISKVTSYKNINSFIYPFKFEPGFPERKFHVCNDYFFWESFQGLFSVGVLLGISSNSGSFSPFLSIYLSIYLYIYIIHIYMYIFFIYICINYIHIYIYT